MIATLITVLLTSRIQAVAEKRLSREQDLDRAKSLNSQSDKLIEQWSATADANASRAEILMAERDTAERRLRVMQTHCNQDCSRFYEETKNGSGEKT